MPNPYIIVISCVTTETVMVSSPSIFYKANEVHLFRYIRDPGTSSAKLYEDHFQSVCKQIRSSLPECLLTEHTDDPVYDLPRMVRALSVLYSRIRKEHPDAEVHANLSSGPSEFIAALGIFAFLNPDVKLFKVATRRYTVGAEEFMLLHYDGDGNAVGLSREVYDPGPVPTVTLDGPDEVLVRSLRLYHQVLERGETPTGPLMMSLLEEKGLWIQSRNNCGKKTSESTLDMMTGTASVFAPLILGMSMMMLAPISEMTGSSGMSGIAGILPIYLVMLAALISVLTPALTSRGGPDTVFRFGLMVPISLTIFYVLSQMSV